MDQLTGLDAAFLYLETERSPMHIGGVGILEPDTPDGPFTLERLRALIAERLHTSRTFTQKLVDVPLNLGRPYWQHDDTFDLNLHVERTQLPEPGGMEELRALVEWEMAQPLDRSRPLWHILLVEGLQTVRNVPPGSLAIIARIHHAAIDGVSGSEIMAALYDAVPRAPGPPATRPPAAGGSGAAPGTLELLGKAGRNLLPGVASLGQAVGDTLKGVVRSGATWAFERVELPPMPFGAPRSVFNATVSKRRIWDCVHLPFERIKKLRQATGGTVNDVVLSVCAGALRAYLDGRGELPDEPMVAMVPISVRGEEQKGAMGNQVSAMLVSLGTHLEQAADRFAHVMRSAYDSKVYHRAVGARTLTDASNIVPFSVAGLAARLYTRMHLAEKHRPIFNLVITNVPGPNIPLYVAGARLLAHVGMAPIFDGMGLMLPVFSYNNRVSIGVVSSPEILPDPRHFTSLFETALADLEAAFDPAADRGKSRQEPP